MLLDEGLKCERGGQVRTRFLLWFIYTVVRIIQNKVEVIGRKLERDKIVIDEVPGET